MKAFGSQRITGVEKEVRRGTVEYRGTVPGIGEAPRAIRPETGRSWDRRSTLRSGETPGRASGRKGFRGDRGEGVSRVQKREGRAEALPPFSATCSSHGKQVRAREQHGGWFGFGASVRPPSRSEAPPRRKPAVRWSPGCPQEPIRSGRFRLIRPPNRPMM